jgi:Uncharacterised nucleotidyltransferase
VLARLAAALSDLPDGWILPAMLDLLRARHRLQLLFSLTITAELFRVLDVLRRVEIDSLVVKGPVLSVRAYGDAATRSYGDLDLLLRQADIPRAAEVLIAAGYESRVPAKAIRAGRIPGEYRFNRAGTKIIVELHTERTFRHFPRLLPIEEYFRHKAFLRFDGHSVPALSAEDEFVFISIHGAKDFWARLLWISDVAALVYNHPELDWKRVRLSAGAVGAERMVRVALLLAERLVGVRVPAEMKDEVSRDGACSWLAREVETWLPYAGYATPSMTKRAAFRFRMHGRTLAGAAYLLRLSLSPTEHDWAADGKMSRSRLGGILHRPFRLAKKYQRNPDS